MAETCAAGVLVIATFAVTVPTARAQLPKRDHYDLGPVRITDSDMGQYEGGRQLSFVTSKEVPGTVAKMTDEGIELYVAKGQPAVWYPAHHYLAAGTTHRCARKGDRAYRLQDVQVGDVIDLGTHKEGDVTYCVDIRIRKRPGGKVPLGLNKPEDYYYSWWEGQNCMHDFLDYGVPLPDKWRDVSVLIDEKIVFFRGPEADEHIRARNAHEKGLPDHHPDADRFEEKYGKKALKAPPAEKKDKE